MKKKLHPIHPGEVLCEEFLKPMSISQNRLALNIGVPPRRINEIVLGKGGLLLIPPSDSQSFLEHLLNFGSDCNHSMI
jgi:hypothetical protein